MIIALLGQKGGSGKSTLACAIAWEMARQGHLVTLVDADPQATARQWAAVGRHERVQTTLERDAIPVTARELEAARAARSGWGSGRYSPPGKGEPVPILVRVGLEAFDDPMRDVGVMIVDTPGRIDRVQAAVLRQADLALLPCGPSPADAWSLAATVDVVHEERRRRPELGAAIVRNRVQAVTTLGLQLGEVLRAADLPILRTEVGYRIAFQDAMARGEGPTSTRPRSAAAAEVRTLVAEVLAKRRPAPVQTSAHAASVR